jgi:hypothetical protein
MLAASCAAVIAAVRLPSPPAARAPFITDAPESIGNTTKVGQPEFDQRDPWLVQRAFDVETGLPEYTAVTPSVEDHDFWLGVTCFGDSRLFLTLSDTEAEVFPADKRELALQIQFDGGASIAIKARYVNGHMIAIDPQTSRSLVVAMIHSRTTQVSSLHVAQSDISRSFIVQPYSPGLDKIFKGCAVGQHFGTAPAL